METHLHPLAGKPAPGALLANIPRLMCAYYAERPDPARADQKVDFGTSGHRGQALTGSFNEAHILATTQAIADCRATFLRRDGGVWTTDKDGIVMGLLAAEMMAVTGRDPAELYGEIVRAHGAPWYERSDAPATPAEKTELARLVPADVTAAQLAGERIEAVLDRAPGDGNALGGLKVIAKNGWFAARPSGTEHVYRIYAESFVDQQHLRRACEMKRRGERFHPIGKETP